MKPNQQLTEVKRLVGAPAALWGAVISAAKREQISVREWMRRAMRERLNWAFAISSEEPTTSAQPRANCPSCGFRAPWSDWVFVETQMRDGIRVSLIACPDCGEHKSVPWVDSTKKEFWR